MFWGYFFVWRYFVPFRKVSTYRLELTRRKQKHRNGNTKRKNMQPAVVFPEQFSAKPPRGRVASCKGGFLVMTRRVHSRVIWDRFLNANVFVGAFGLEIDIMGTDYFIPCGFSKDLSVWGGDSANMCFMIKDVDRETSDLRAIFCVGSR